MEYLYHYTNIEALACILKNRTIRFSSIDQLDDLQEGACAHEGNYGKYCFVSSWTSSYQEDIPMWRMYTKKQAGVRIKVRKDPFVPHDAAEGLSVESHSEMQRQVVPVRRLLMDKFICIPQSIDNLLHEVDYTDDSSRLSPSIVESEGKGISFKFEMGKCKNKYWEFQKEWRYIIHILPVDASLFLSDKLAEFYDKLHNVITAQASLGFSHFDLSFADEAFDDMEITCCPDLSYGNRIILESLVEKYNPRAVIRESDLSGLLR